MFYMTILYKFFKLIRSFNASLIFLTLLIFNLHIRLIILYHYLQYILPHFPILSSTYMYFLYIFFSWTFRVYFFKVTLLHNTVSFWNRNTSTHFSHSISFGFNIYAHISIICLVKFARKRYTFMSYEIAIVWYTMSIFSIRIYLYFDDYMECFPRFARVICILHYSASDMYY